jgi:hypothetical protein
MPKRIKNMLDFFTKFTGLVQAILAIVGVIIAAAIWLIRAETNDIRVEVKAVKAEVSELRKDVSQVKSVFGIKDRVSDAGSNNTSVSQR